MSLIKPRIIGATIPLGFLPCKHWLRRASQQKHVGGERTYIHDGRNRCSNLWTPFQRGQNEQRAKGELEDSNDLLRRAGFIRQAYSGIFHFLPLGLRVQDKVERLLDQHMQKLGASKLALSSLSSWNLWAKSGRTGAAGDMFTLSDRKQTKFLLSPTHEEEITQLVGSAAWTQRDLPVRLYQITRKYRDEPRPRQGLMRGREFLMKDLYSFDVDRETAIATYEEVKAAYISFFDRLRLPYLVANASSGNMGGTHSHEFHLPSPKGEDTLLQCSECGTVTNSELLTAEENRQANCPACSNSPVQRIQAIELGHTFYLGTKYTQALGVKVSIDRGSGQGVASEHPHMGCYGIGVSRLIAASASALADSKGLNWPRAIAPFEVAVVPHGSRDGDVEGCKAVYDQLVGNGCVDAIIDDRKVDWVQKLKDADLVGYPVIMFLGKEWREKGSYQVQCRRKGFKADVEAADLEAVVAQLLDAL